MSAYVRSPARSRLAAVPAVVLLLAVAACGSSPKSAAPTTTLPPRPPTTTTAPTNVLPGVPPCDPGAPGGNVPQVRPSLIFVGCGSSTDQLQDIDWSGWTATGATGTATHAINDCSPNCAQGSFTDIPVNVSLSVPSHVNGMLVFTTISFVPSDSTAATETDTVGWGWAPA